MGVFILFDWVRFFNSTFKKKKFHGGCIALGPCRCKPQVCVHFFICNLLSLLLQCFSENLKKKASMDSNQRLVMSQLTTCHK